MPCAIASASKNAPFILEKLGVIDLFDAIVDPATLTKGKPDPEIRESRRKHRHQTRRSDWI